MVSKDSLQESEPPLSPEEQDQLKRSNKKIKTSNEQHPSEEMMEGIVEELMEEAEHNEAKENGSPDEDMPELEDATPLGESKARKSLFGHGKDLCPEDPKNKKTGSQEDSDDLRTNNVLNQDKRPEMRWKVMFWAKKGNLPPPVSDVSRGKTAVKQINNIVELKSNEPRPKPKKSDQISIGPKKPPIVASVNSRRSNKTPSEKAHDHIVVTSQPQNTRPSPTQLPSKSPSKGKEGLSKNPVNKSMDQSKVKHKKPPDYNESLALIKIAEKMYNQDTILSELGAVQVYTNHL
ncbi:uncharacterized protein G2W53_029821 [Senna tora]|uniref:Uncharacterized protein n=1 Tax=Senna tora TaxID=362788 RepID=A0A834T8A4_9FABA|nr:uncharacterized protein G2W53_029821 [Senna tora]